MNGFTDARSPINAINAQDVSRPNLILHSITKCICPTTSGRYTSAHTARCATSTQVAWRVISTKFINKKGFLFSLKTQNNFKVARKTENAQVIKDYKVEILFRVILTSSPLTEPSWTRKIEMRFKVIKNFIYQAANNKKQMNAHI